MATLTVRNIDDQLLERAKKLSGEVTGSQALLSCVSKLEKILEEKREIRKIASDMEFELRHYKQFYECFNKFMEQGMLIKSMYKEEKMNNEYEVDYDEEY